MENKWMKIKIDVQKITRWWHSIYKNTGKDIKVLLKWEFLQIQQALTNICPLSAYFSYHKTLIAYGTVSRKDTQFSVLIGENHLYFSSEVCGSISIVIWTTGLTFFRVSDSQVMVQFMANTGKMSTNVFIFLSLLASNSKDNKNRYN